MSKYNKLKKQIFVHDWLMNNNLEYCKKIVFSIARIELENSEYRNVNVIENIFAEKGLGNTWIVGQVVECTNKIGKCTFTNRYLEINELSYICNRFFINHIHYINDYNLDKLKI